jgi:hypothetical protein
MLSWNMLLGKLGFGFDDDNLYFLVLAQKVGYDFAFWHKEPALFDCADSQLLFSAILVAEFKINIKSAIGKICDSSFRSDGSNKVKIAIGNDFQAEILPFLLSFVFDVLKMHPC